MDEEAIRKGFNELENKGKVLDFDVFKELVSCANNQTENEVYWYINEVCISIKRFF